MNIEDTKKLEKMLEKIDKEQGHFIKKSLEYFMAVKNDPAISDRIKKKIEACFKNMDSKSISCPLDFFAELISLQKLIKDLLEWERKNAPPKDIKREGPGRFEV